MTGRSPEAAWLAGLLAGVLAVNLGTGARCPAVWIDEAAYCDPAVNLWLGHGFVSSAWYAQGDHEFWAGNVPLYPLLMYGWLLLFGVSVLAVRSLSYVLITISAVVLWAAVRRLGLVRSAGHRLAMIALVLCGFGVCFNYRIARPDCLCILLASTAMLAASVPRRTVRLGTLAALGVLFPIAGLQLVVFAAVVCLLLLVFLKGRYFKESVALGAGCVAGGATLWLVYWHLGVWEALIASTVGTHSAVGLSGVHPARLLTFPGGLKDPSYLVLLATVVGLAVVGQFRGSFRWRSPLAFAVAAGVAIPLMMDAVRGQFPCYYSWMAYVPMCIGLSAALSSASGRPSSKPGRLAVPAVLTAACLAGLPFVTGLTLSEWRDRDYGRVERLVSRHVHAGDCVYHDGSSYFAVKGRAAFLAGWRRLVAMSPEDKARVNVLVVRPGAAAKSVQARIGGRWVPCGRPVRPARPPLFGVASEYFLDKYDLQVYRRVTAGPKTPAQTTFACRRREGRLLTPR